MKTIFTHSTKTFLFFFLIILVTFTNGYAQESGIDGDYCPAPGTPGPNGDEYATGTVFSQLVDPNASSTCEIYKIWAKIYTDGTGEKVLKIGLKIGNSGSSLFRLYLDTDKDPTSGLTLDQFGGPLIVAGADYILELDAQNNSTFTLYFSDVNDHTTKTVILPNGSSATNGDSNGCSAGDGQFLEFNIPFKSLNIDICDPDEPGVITITKLASVSGGSPTSSRCTDIPLTFVIPLKGSVGPDATVCEVNNSTDLSITGLTGSYSVTKWQYSTDGGTVWYDITNTTLYHTAINLTETTLFRALIMYTGLCINPIPTSAATITVNPLPTTANAGTDQTKCETTTANLSGNTPTVGTGNWTLASGAGAITTPTSPTTEVTALGYGANVFRWTISNGTICTPSTADVTITRYQTPTTANVGTNQEQCETATATITGNTPTVGTGNWTLVSGAGAITTPTSPTTEVTALGYGANVFRWTISNGTCTASTANVTITRHRTPTTANAGPDQTKCETTFATLAGNTPTVGTGNWTLVSGAGAITTPTSPTSGVTALGYGANIFRWTISNGTCTSSTDEITITRYQTPSTANAGTDQEQCETTTATLSGNTPTVGTGNWTLVSGAGAITTPTSPTTGVTALGYGANVFRWTISNGTCTASTDVVTITRYQTPTMANAGPDQTKCETTTATLAGNTPTVGTGTWTLVSGAGTISNIHLATSGVTALGYGANVFRWTISNGPCTASTDEVTITRYQTPTTANAGTNQSQCEVTTATLSGNTPTMGTGNWTLVSGAGAITTPTSPTTEVTALGYGANVFRWTISNGTCTASTDEMTITRYQTPTTANAGPDQNKCETTTATLAGNTPTVGTGTWTLVSGAGAITTPTSPTSGVSALGYGANVFRWTISNGACTASTDEVTITRYQTPTTANAGTDQTKCETTTATLAGNTPTVGTGNWTLVSGAGTITTPTSPTTEVTALGYGANIFRWTISNGTCTASTDVVTVTRYLTPTVANAGTNQEQCEATTATLAGNTPTVGTGTWTLVSGAGTITTPTSPTSGVTALGYEANIFRWTISNGTCTSSTDEMTITRYKTPTTANAGTDQTKCNNGSFTLAANAASVGEGTWTVVSGIATIADIHLETSVVTSVPAGSTAVLKWEIINGTCNTEDTVTLIVNLSPAAPISGGDITECKNLSTQTLTATATVPAGQHIIWYNAATNGNIVETPTLNTVGSVTYYAQAVNDETSCISLTRTPVTLTIKECVIAIVKTNDIVVGENGCATLKVGDVVTYTFTVTNLGNESLNDVTVLDPHIGLAPIALQSGDSNNNSILEITEIWIYKATYTVTQTDIDNGKITNQASVKGFAPNGNEVND
ncbi:DUF7507 domain-containing protein, partial [Flavobacterium laiguense]